MKIYLNGEILSEKQATISPSDRGLLLGDGIFETMRAYNGRIFQIDAHLNRLMASADFLQIPIALSRDALSQALAATLDANHLSESDATLRLTLTRGAGSRGLDFPPNPKPTLLISAALLLKTDFPPAKALIVNIRRNQYSPLFKIKSLNYLDNVLARHEAKSQGFDEALLCNTEGQLAEASAANLFIVKKDTLLTPPIEDGALPGVTRAIVFELASALAIPCQEKSLTLDDLAQADEAFLTNSIIEVQPLIQVGEQTIGDGKIGPITAQIQRVYHRLTIV